MKILKKYEIKCLINKLKGLLIVKGSNNNLHNIVSKKQHVEQSNIVFNGTLKAGYDLTYNYNKPFQISTLQDENYRTEGDVEKDKIANEHVYKYDASGERVIKSSGDNEAMFVNSVFSCARTSTDNFTAYINPYLVVSKGDNYTKHIYIGSQHIVSKLGDLDSYGQDPRRIAYAGSDVDGVNIDFKGKCLVLKKLYRLK